MIAATVASKPGRLTHKEIRFLRTFLGMSQGSLGHAVGATDQTVSLWERNRQKIPHASEAVLRQLALEMADGNHKIAEIIERINTVERLVNQKIVATEARHKWKAEITKGEVVPA